MILEQKENPKIRKDDRILVLRPKEGLKAKNSTGITDPRLFSGENKLHIIRGRSQMWYFKYDMGILPEPLKEQKFTKFDVAYKFVVDYYARRNIEVVEVID